ncbi:MAG: hypothetical protein FWH06_00820 [Oscillospiraceae bacterium]|nr:hypothetical protein [Oscillospiraceae bacterium]
MKDCKTCRHATTVYKLDKENRFSASYSPLGWVYCAAPRYNGRAYFCRDTRANCGEHEPKGRSAT